MTSNASLISRIVSHNDSKSGRIALSLITHIVGVLLLSALAQVSIRLPFTPVPITGQTFGVALVALSFGKTRGTLVFATYFILGGFFNMPIFAMGASGLAWAPTLGYLMGMFLATFVMGYLADLGWTKSVFKTYLASVIGSTIIFSCGLLVLKNYVPSSALLISGLWPFLPGDFVKSILASFIVSKANSNFCNSVK